MLFNLVSNKFDSSLRRYDKISANEGVSRYQILLFKSNQSGIFLAYFLTFRKFLINIACCYYQQW